MSYVVNTGEDKLCDKCKSKIGIAKGFYTQWGRILCIHCQESFVNFVKQKYNEFIQPERLSPEGFQRNGANQNIDKDYVDMVKGISPDLLGSSDSPNSTNK